MEQENAQLHFDLQIDPISQEHLSSAAKWAKFLSIVGFVMIGIFVLIGIFAGSMMAIFGRSIEGAGSALGSGFFTIIYLLIAAIYFFPCLYLYRFATRMQAAISSMDQNQLNDAFANLKSCFKFMGILTIVMLAIYALAIVVTLAGAAFSVLR